MSLVHFAFVCGARMGILCSNSSLGGRDINTPKFRLHRAAFKLMTAGDTIVLQKDMLAIAENTSSNTPGSRFLARSGLRNTPALPAMGSSPRKPVGSLGKGERSAHKHSLPMQTSWVSVLGSDSHSIGIKIDPWSYWGKMEMDDDCFQPKQNWKRSFQRYWANHAYVMKFCGMILTFWPPGAENYKCPYSAYLFCLSRSWDPESFDDSLVVT